MMTRGWIDKLREICKISGANVDIMNIQIIFCEKLYKRLEFFVANNNMFDILAFFSASLGIIYILHAAKRSRNVGSTKRYLSFYLYFSSIVICIERCLTIGDVTITTAT